MSPRSVQRSVAAESGFLPADVLPVSVIIAAYGHADYIVDSIASVLGQVPPPHEVIVVDDGSPDDTGARVASLAAAGRIRYVRQVNAGMAAARNAGASLATGEYLYFLDDDDRMLPDAMAVLVEELEGHPKAGMAYGHMLIFDETPPSDTSSTKPRNQDADDVDRVPFILFNQIGCPGQVLIRRSAFQAVGGFDPSIWGTDDWDLWLRLLERYPARIIPNAVHAYRLHANNSSRNVAAMYESSLRVARAHLVRFPAAMQPVLRRGSYSRLRDYHAPRLVTMARERVRRGDWTLAFRAARAWLRSWGMDLSGRFALKAHLVRRGRWRLPRDEALLQLMMRS